MGRRFALMRSYDLDLLNKAIKLVPDLNDQTDYAFWLEDRNNLMFAEGDNVGLATYEYPGVYSVHWFFHVRGREALNLAIQMLHSVFHDYDGKVVRGMTPANLRAARWGCRQLGFKSYGIEDTLIGPHEVFLMTREEFYERNKV